LCDQVRFRFIRMNAKQFSLQGKFPQQ
jgi:hypothetical protein